MGESLRQMASSSLPSDYSSIRDRWESAQRASSTRYASRLSTLQSMEGMDETFVMRREDEQQDEADGFAEIADLVGASESMSHAPAVANAVATQEFDSLLGQLKNMPNDDDELSAKFGIYEKYSEDVTQLRGTVFDLFNSSKATLPNAVKADMEKQLQRFDRTEALGIADDAHGWFVYHMMKQAGRNNQNLGSVLASFEKKLEFLAQNDQDACPICLESFSESRPAITLGCCHKTCSACWEHWVAVMHGHPYCPLCRNREFVETIARRSAPFREESGEPLVGLPVFRPAPRGNRRGGTPCCPVILVRLIKFVPTKLAEFVCCVRMCLIERLTRR